MEVTVGGGQVGELIADEPHAVESRLGKQYYEFLMLLAAGLAHLPDNVLPPAADVHALSRLALQTAALKVEEFL